MSAGWLANTAGKKYYKIGLTRKGVLKMKQYKVKVNGMEVYTLDQELFQDDEAWLVWKVLSEEPKEYGIDVSEGEAVDWQYVNDDDGLGVMLDEMVDKGFVDDYELKEKED